MPRDLNNHNGALDYLVNHLDIIGLERKNIAWIVTEPTIFHKGSMHNEQACDVVVGYEIPYKHVDLIELKHSTDMRGKARKQIYNTEKHLTSNWGYQVENKYLVIYPTFTFEKLT